MAERRMFSKTIIDSDAFLDMPATTQLLYFHLSMRADDDGFVNNPKKIQRMTGCSDDDLRLLMLKQYILTFESGVIVIKHWKMHNYIQSDRYKSTIYKDEKSMLELKDNKEYVYNLDTECIQNVYKLDTNCIQNGYNLDTQVRLGKDRLGQDSIGKEIYIDIPAENINAVEVSPAKNSKNSKSVRHKYGNYDNVLLTDEDLEKLKAEFPYDWEQRIEKLSEYMASTGKSYKNHLATIRNWSRNERPTKQQQNNRPMNNFEHKPNSNKYSNLEE